MQKLKSLKRFADGYFWVSRDEVTEVMRRADMGTVTEVMRLLFPRLCFYKCARHGGFWGRVYER